MNQINRTLTTLIATALAATAINCGDTNTKVNETPRSFREAQVNVDHRHESRIFAPVGSEEQYLKMEEQGFSVMTIPYADGPGNLKDHLGEWTILQVRYAHDAPLAEMVLPYMDGNPQEARLYNPLAMQRLESGQTTKVPRLYLQKGKPDYVETLPHIPIYTEKTGAEKDIGRIERVLRHKRDVPNSPNITLEPVQITPELIRQYVK